MRSLPEIARQPLQVVCRLLDHWLAAVVAMCWAACLLGTPARADEAMAQRTRACTACHGEQGRAGPDGYYPRLAGKPAGYLFHQLQHFRDGRRHYGLMNRLLQPLSDDYLMRIAQHFADQQVPYPPPLPLGANERSTAAAGEALALRGDAARGLPACTACHGATLTGVLPATPGLLGLPRDYITAQLGAWRAGQRRAHAPDCMAEIAQKLTLPDIHALSLWLSAQPAPAPARPATQLKTEPPMKCGSVLALR